MEKRAGPESKAAIATRRIKPSGRLKLELPKAGTGGGGPVPVNIGELDRDAPVSKTHLDLISEGQKFIVE